MNETLEYEEVSPQGLQSETTEAPLDEGFENNPVILNSNDILDATQNAIIGAAENVSEVLSVPEPIRHEHKPEPFYADVEFWVGMSFVLVVLMIAKPVFRAIKNKLKQNIQNIRDNIDNAIKLRDEAQNLLADYERKCADLDEKLQQIKQQTENNLENYRKAELIKLQNSLNKKEKDVVARINRTTQKAKNDINATISQKTFDLVEKSLQKFVTLDDKVRFIDEAISDLDTIINKKSSDKSE